MISMDLPAPLQERFIELVQESYDGNLQAAITAFLKLHEKYGWKEQLLADVTSIRSEVRRKGGIKAKAIDHAIQKYRRSLD